MAAGVAGGEGESHGCVESDVNCVALRLEAAASVEQERRASSERDPDIAASQSV